MEINPEKALNYVIENAPKYAQAKGNRRYLEEFRKTTKARLYNQSPEGTIAEREAYAYSHKDYIQVLEGLKEAIELEEELAWRMKAALTKVDVWRSQEASNRAIEGKTV